MRIKVNSSMRGIAGHLCQTPNQSNLQVIRVYDDAGNVIETYEHAGEFKEPQSSANFCKAKAKRS